MSSLKYACTALVGTNKGGVLKPDANGYYRMILGAFNIYNSAGLWYNYETSKHIFDSSSSFMRRMSAGNLYSEEDHPQWVDGTPLDMYVARIKRIEPKNICAHIRDIEVVPGDMSKDGSQVMLIYGSVKPDRERGKYLKEALDNPDQNVCFSLRALCDDKYINGRIERTITEFITFDWVVEPGLHVAHKYNAPGLESFACESREEMPIPIEAIESLIAKKAQMQAQGVGLESDEDYTRLQEIVDQHKAPKNSMIAKPAAMKW